MGTLDALIARLTDLRSLHGGDIPVMVIDFGPRERDARFKQTPASVYLNHVPAQSEKKPAKDFIVITDESSSETFEFLIPLIVGDLKT